MIKQTTILVFLFFPQFFFSMDSLHHDSIITKAIWIEHLWRNAGAFSHRSICALALVDKELYIVVRKTAGQRKLHLMSQKNRIESSNVGKKIQQEVWHKHNSAYSYWVRNGHSTEATFYFVQLNDNNEIVSNHQSDELNYLKYVKTPNLNNFFHICFDNKGTVLFIGPPFANKKNITEYSLNTKNVLKKRQLSINWQCNNTKIDSHAHYAALKLYTEKIIANRRADFFIKDKHNHNAFYVGGSFSNDITLIDMTSAEQKSVLQGHTKLIRCCIDVPHDDLLISGSHDETIKIWDTRTNELLETLDACPCRTKHKLGDVIFCLAQEENHFCSSSLSNNIKLWDLPTGKIIWHTFNINTGPILGFAACSLMMRNNLLYMGSGSGELTIVDLRFGGIISQEHAHKRQISCLIPFKKRDMHFYSGSHDGVVNQWDMRSSKFTALGMHDYGISCLYESPDGRKLFSGGADGIRVWDNTGTIKQPLNIIKEFDMNGKTQKLAYIDCIATNYNADQLYTSSTSGILRLSLHYPFTPQTE